MSIDWGALPLNTVVPFIFTSHDAATGANETMSGLALADILVYKGTSLTQRSSTAGFAFFGGDADGLDLDTFTGVNGVSIDTADNTDSGFFAAGSLYTVVLGPITIDAQTVYTVLGTFRLVAAEAIAGKPKVDVDAWLGTAAATPTTAGVPEVDVTHVGGTAQTAGDLKASLNTIDDFLDTEIAALIVDVDAIEAAVITNAAGVDIAADIIALKAETAAILEDTGTTLDDLVDNLEARLGTPSDLGSGATVAANLVDIEAQTDDIGAAGVGLTAIPTVALVTLVTTTTTLTNAPADSAGVTTLLTRLSALRAGYLDNLSAGAAALEGSLQALITTVGVAGAGLTAAATAVWAVVARTLTAGTNIVLAKGVGVTGFNDLSAAAVNAEVDTALADYDGPTHTELTAELATADDAVLAQVALVKAKTDNLPTDPADESLIIAATDAIVAAIAALNNLSQANVRTAVGLASANLDTQLDALPTNAELATAIAALFTTAMTESYNADGSPPTPAQALFVIMQMLTEMAISGTTMTIKRLDGTTTAFTLTLDAAAPTSVTRAT